MDILGIAQQGLQKAQGQFEQTAQRVAQSGLGPAAAQPSDDSVSLSDNAVSLITSKNQFATDLGLAHMADKMQKATLNLLG